MFGGSDGHGGREREVVVEGIEVCVLLYFDICFPMVLFLVCFGFSISFCL